MSLPASHKNKKGLKTIMIHDIDRPLLNAIPERDLVEMAIDLDIFVPEKIDRMQMIEQCIWAILKRARAEGLPLSRYDQDDLEALGADGLNAMSKLMGLSGPASVEKIIKKGRRVYKSYQKHRPDNATALLIPTLLPLIARAAAMPKIQ